MPVVPNKDFNAFLNGGDPKKTPSIGVEDLSVSSPTYGLTTVNNPTYPSQSSVVFDKNMGGVAPDYLQEGFAPVQQQVVQAPPTNIYQNILGGIIKNNQNNGKLINQAVDPVFDYIKQQQANSIYPDLGDTTNADYYPSAGVMTSSTSDPMYGSFNQYATQSLTPYAIYDKRNAALQKAAAASIPDLTGLKSKVPDAYVSYKDDVGEKTLKTTQDYIAEGQKLGYGKHTYEILEKGIGDLGQRYQRDISNINTIASKTKDIGKYVDDIYNEEAKGGFVPKVVHDAVEKFRSGSTDLWSGKGTDLELDKLVGQIQSAPNMMTTISANKFAQDEFATMIQDSGLKGIGQNKELTYQQIKQVLKPRADKLAEEIWNSNSLYKQYYTKDQISNMIVESNGQQAKDIYKSVSLKSPVTNVNVNTGDYKTKQDLVFNESGTLTRHFIGQPSGTPQDGEVHYDYGLTLPESARKTVSAPNSSIKLHNAGNVSTRNMKDTDWSQLKTIGIYRVPVKKNGDMIARGTATDNAWYLAGTKPVKYTDPKTKEEYTEEETYYIPFDESLQQQFGYTVDELNNTINTSIQPTSKLKTNPPVERNEVGSSKMKTISRYGTYEGKKIIEYTDGTTEYAE